MIKNIFKMTPARLALDIVLLACVVGLIGLVVSVIWMPGKSYKGPSAAETETESALEIALRKHVTTLAGDIGQRNTESTLKQSRDYLRSYLEKFGYTVKEQRYKVDNDIFMNLEVEKEGRNKNAGIVIVGAHYDSVSGSPGANDNGSGVATVLELAREFANKSSLSSIRFVLFANEEPPFFSSTEMGSYHYAERCAERREPVKAVLIMETLGFYTDKPNSQTYPSNFVPGYPHTGNFIAFVGNQSSRALTEQCVASFRASCKFPSEGVAAPNWVNGVDWSDQYWFWKHNYKALMITDTALFRYSYYHTMQDTPDKLNYPSFARVVTGLEHVLESVASAQ
jgi:hypothetical protein